MFEAAFINKEVIRKEKERKLERLRDEFAMALAPAVYAEYMAGHRNKECELVDGWMDGVLMDSYALATSALKAREIK